MGLSHLKSHKFNHSFKDVDIPFCSCRIDIEDTEHFLLRCQNYTEIRSILIKKVSSLYNIFPNLSPSQKTAILLFGDSENLSFEINRSIFWHGG